MTDGRAGRRRRWRLVAIGAALVAVLAAGGGLLVAQQSAAADPVLTATAERRDVTRSVSGTGTLVDEVTYAIAADGTATVAARAGTAEEGAAAQTGGQASTVQAVDVEPGQAVRRDQRLARVEGAGGTDRDVESPVAGHVREVTAAKDATAGRLMTIGAGRVLAALTVSENQIAQVRTGQSVALTLAAGTASTTGVVDAIEQVPDDSSGALRYTVLVRPDGVPAGARIGMSATGAITTARADDVVAVPAAAIEVHGDAVRVTVERGGTTTRVPVRLGLIGDDAVQVTSGLRAGQRVVVGAAGEVATTTSRLGPPSSVTGSTPGATPTAGTAR